MNVNLLKLAKLDDENAIFNSEHNEHYASPLLLVAIVMKIEKKLPSDATCLETLQKSHSRGKSLFNFLVVSQGLSDY